MSDAQRNPILPVLVVVLLAAVGWWGWRSYRSRSVAEAVETIAEDDRVRWLVAPCGFTRVFDVDTSDMVHVLVESLGWGQRDALIQARMELAEIGPAVLPELQRSFEASFSQAFEHGIVENILGTCTIAAEPWGLELLRRGARHPGESVRSAAVSGIAKHGVATDYDLVKSCLELASTRSARINALGTMARVDPERLGRDLARWIELGESEDLWAEAVVNVGSIHDPETVRELAGLAEATPQLVRLHLLAPAARDGDERALQTLRAALGDAQASQREHALRALASVGLGMEARGMLELDPVASLRLKAATAIASLEPSEETVAWLSIGLSDRDSDVRDACLESLCAWGDERAIAQALESLRGSTAQRNAGLRGLRKAFDVDPATIDRSRAFVLGLLGERTGPIDALEVALLQALGQIPGRESAEHMLWRARSATGRVSGWRAHRWCTHQASNTGEEGRLFLLEALSSESDPLRLVDLIFAGTQSKSAQARALLREILEDSGRDPHLRVFACHRLIEQGPATTVAPYLKRVYMSTTDPILRPALQCMLWSAYGAHRP